MRELARNREISPYIGADLGNNRWSVLPGARGQLKMVMAQSGFPVEDLAGYVEGEPLAIALRETMADSGAPFTLRDYQREAAQVFYSSGSAKGGSGVIVLPCGSGKTVIGMASMALVQARTLIVTPNVTAARQWIRELLTKTTLTADQVKEYSGDVKEVGPVTVATYQILTYRNKRGTAATENETSEDTEVDEDGVLIAAEPKVKKRGRPSKSGKDKLAAPTPALGNATGEGSSDPAAEGSGVVFSHFPLIANHNWGLIIYDEVHLLPAPVFRFSAEVQATRRLGLTATLVREDGREREVFSLIGPKKYDIPWRILESQGWIAAAVCHEVRIPMLVDRKMEYAMADLREKIRLASCNPVKDTVVDTILSLHEGEEDRVLIIGQYIEQIERMATERSIPIITGKTPNPEREALYAQFRSGAVKRLVVSKVGNFAIDLPDANVLIQVSGTFGSRQEEAQRLGRVLRPKKDGRQASFYTLVTRESREAEFAMNRQLFLAEQGYAYKILQYQHGMTGIELLASHGMG